MPRVGSLNCISGEHPDSVYGKRINRDNGRCWLSRRHPFPPDYLDSELIRQARGGNVAFRRTPLSGHKRPQCSSSELVDWFGGLAPYGLERIAFVALARLATI